MVGIWRRVVFIIWTFFQGLKRDSVNTEYWYWNYWYWNSKLSRTVCTKSMQLKLKQHRHLKIRFFYGLQYESCYMVWLKNRCGRRVYWGQFFLVGELPASFSDLPVRKTLTLTNINRYFVIINPSRLILTNLDW